MENKKGAFTLVELIVVITILAILWTIAIMAFSGYSKNARDSARISDINNIMKSLELFYLQSSFYPDVSNAFNVTYSGSTAWKQWTFWESVFQNVGKLEKKPVDPLTENEYTYSVTNTKNEYEVAAIMEWDNSFSLIHQTYAATEGTAMVKWNYNGKYVKLNIGPTLYILWTPTIITTEIAGTDIENIVYTKKSLVFSNYSNLPSSNQTGWFNFEPGSGSIILFSWDESILSTSTGKLILAGNLDNYYSPTILQNNTNYTDVINIDVTNNPNGAISLINNFLKNKILTSSEWSSSSSSCTWTIPSNAEQNGNEGTSIWEYSVTPWVCKFTCQEWYDWDWSNSCTDQTAPALWDFTLPSTTETTTISLTISCPLDTIGWTNVEMFIAGSWLASGWNTWEACASSKNVSVSTWDGTKNISIKWRDLSLNETSEVSKNTTLSSPFFSWNGTSGSPWLKWDSTALKSCQEYNTLATQINSWTSRWSGTCWNWTQECLSDGVYYIAPDSVQNNKFAIYCDMASNWGGWSLVYKNSLSQGLAYNNINLQWSSSCLEHTTDNCSAKLNDTHINLIKTITSDSIWYRTTSPNIANKYYFPGSCVYKHDWTNWNTHPTFSQCTRFTATYTPSPSYIQCSYWWWNAAGLNAWYQCNGNASYTNVVVTNRWIVESGWMTTNVWWDPLWWAWGSYSNTLYMWVK